MSTYQQITRVRARKLGILIYDARTLRNRTIESCAEAVGVTPEQFIAYESGDQPPSLPQLESLAYFLDMPLEHFWGNRAESVIKPPAGTTQSTQLSQIRQKMIAAQLRLARSNLNLTTLELSQKTSISQDRIEAYETGTIAVALPDLEILCDSLQISIEALFDHRGPIGEWRLEKLAQRKYLDLPLEIREFVTVPGNQPYLQIAQRLSELPAEKLRTIAESLLEITY